jgi:hypothetical protein
MTQLILLRYLSFLILIISATANIGLQTQKGTIYGRETQYSVEYLG